MKHRYLGENLYSKELIAKAYILSPKISTKKINDFPMFFWWENYIIYTLHQPFSGKMTQIGKRNILNLERDSYVPPIAIMMGERKRGLPKNWNTQKGKQSSYYQLQSSSLLPPPQKKKQENSPFNPRKQFF